LATFLAWNFVMALLFLGGMVYYVLFLSIYLYCSHSLSLSLFLSPFVSFGGNCTFGFQAVSFFAENANNVFGSQSRKTALGS
jgi:hypothetical protein